MKINDPTARRDNPAPPASPDQLHAALKKHCEASKRQNEWPDQLTKSLMRHCKQSFDMNKESLPDQRTPVERWLTKEENTWLKNLLRLDEAQGLELIIERLCAELERHRTMSVCELAAVLENASLNDFMSHWEGRALKAEREAQEQRQRAITAEALHAGATEAQLRAEADLAKLRECHDLLFKESTSLLKERDTAQAEAGRLREAAVEFRESVLSGRQQLAENGMTSDQTNDVLGLFDDTIGAALAHGKDNKETP